MSLTPPARQRGPSPHATLTATPEYTKKHHENIVILISGRGLNMQAIVEAQLPGARIAAVIANWPDAAGLPGRLSVALPPPRWIIKPLPAAKISTPRWRRRSTPLPRLGGAGRLYAHSHPGFTQHYAGRMFNIHPRCCRFSGLHTHQRALDAGCRLAGATVHFVTAELDHGPIVAQGVVAVADDDTADSLAGQGVARGASDLPQAVRWFVEGRHLTLAGQRVRVDGGSADGALVCPR